MVGQLEQVAHARQLTVGHHADPSVPWPGKTPRNALMKRGDILLLSAYTPHQSQFNTTLDEVRWSLDLRFQRVGEPNGRAPQPSFVVRSRSNPASEERDYNSWRWKHQQGQEQAKVGVWPSGRH